MIQSQIAEEEGIFTLDDVVSGIRDKIITWTVTVLSGSQDVRYRSGCAGVGNFFGNRFWI